MRKLLNRRDTLRLGVMTGGYVLASSVPCFGQMAAPASEPGSPLRFLTDRQMDAMAAPFALARETGLFQDQSINVTIGHAGTTGEAITQVATGQADLALADLNALIRYRDKADAVPIKAIYIYQVKAPYAIIARKSRGITTLPTLAGKTIGILTGDLTALMWPALAKRHNVKPNAVKQERISPAVREPMLSAGQIDGITGFSYLSAVNLRNRGIPNEDLDIFRFADYGLSAYGTAIIVNPDFAERRPEAVRGFLRAVAIATQIALSEPDRAVDAVMKLMPSGSRELELARLHAILADQLLGGSGGQAKGGEINPTRFAESVQDIAEGFSFRNRPKLDDIFNDAFLPDRPPVAGN